MFGPGRARHNTHFEWCGPGEPTIDDRGTDGKPRVRGKLYIDGSCSTHVFAELRRAASSVVQWAYAARGGWKVSYPVPRELPQTPQAAEYVALGLARKTADRREELDVASDCANVVVDATSRRGTSTRATKVYAAINRENLANIEWVRNAAIRKVPAHIKPEAAVEGRAREDAIGNGKADEAAREALKLHPQPAPTMVTQLDAQLKRAKYVIRTIAAVTQTFPSMPHEKFPRPPRPIAGAQIGVDGGHTWSYAAGMWRCTTCLKLTLSAAIGAKQLRDRCKGMKPNTLPQSTADKGHHLAKKKPSGKSQYCFVCDADLSQPAALIVWRRFARQRRPQREDRRSLE